MGLNPFGSSGPGTIRVDEDLNNHIYTRAREHDPVGIRPYRESGGLEKGERLLNSLHDVERGGFLNRKNASAAHAFELHYSDTDEALSFRFVPGDEHGRQLLTRQLKTFYEDSDVMDPQPQFLTIEPGDYIAGADLTLRQTSKTGRFRPIKHFKIDPDHFSQDPYDAITAEMVNDGRSAADTDVLIQIVIRPAVSDPNSRKKWYQDIEDAVQDIKEPGMSFDFGAVVQEAGRALNPGAKEGVDSFSKTMDLSQEQKRAAEVVANQHGSKGYHVNVRVFAASGDADEAAQRVSKTAKMFRKFYDSKFEQGFTPEFKSGSALRELIERGVDREYVDNDITFSSGTTVNICHVPTDINTQQADYSQSTSGLGIPPATPRFDFEAAGVADADDLDKQTAMLDTTDRDAPYWYGWGTKNGVEAGVSPDLLNVHQFVGGGTGFGKTTLLNNFSYQIAQRDHGLLYTDPKGTGDAEDFLSVIPDHRKDDVIYIEVGGDREQQVGFNFLEPPTEAEPGTSTFESAVESIADDVAALLAQAGGDQDYWGPRMNQITRNLVRGMAKSGMQCTLFDQWAALNPDGLDRYAEQMSEERIDFIEDFARNELQDMDDSEIRPVKSRYQQWVENPIIRDLVSYPESTVSIEDAVAEGKIIIVNNKVASDTVKQLFTTALLRRTWMAVREQTYRGEDPPPFFAVCDEFDSIITEQSNIHSILSEARSFGYCLTLACQSPSNQLPENVAHAIENQCRTFLSFNAGGERDAAFIAGQHSQEIEVEDLTNLSSYRIFMRTEDNHGDLTHSYKADTFPPVEWAIDERDDEEVESLIERSLEQYGVERRTAEDIKRDSVFYGDDTAEDDDDTEDFAVTETVTAHTCKAVYDQAIRADAPDGWIRADHGAERIRRYLPDDAPLGTNEKLWGNLLDAVPESYIEREHRDDGVYLRTTDQGKTSIFASGSSQNAGGGGHRLLLRDLYEPLTELGFVVEIPDQDGSDLPDAVASLADIDLLQIDDGVSGPDPTVIADRVAQFREDFPLLDRLSDGHEVAIEAESTTGTTAPSQSIQNLAQAVSQDKHCLFAVREDDASHVWNTVADNPACMREYSDDGVHRLYNANTPLRIGGKTMYRSAEAAQTKWLYDTRVDEYILADSDGAEHARFETADAIFERPETYPLAEGETGDYDDWTPIKHPVVPERLFDGGTPDSDMWDIIVVPNDGGQLSVYDGETGGLIPIDDLAEQEQATSSLSDI